jgi:hypothetical protein
MDRSTSAQAGSGQGAERPGEIRAVSTLGQRAALAGGPRRARRVALLLAGVTLALVAGGGWWFVRFAWHLRRDPGVVYRDPTTLDNLLKRAGDAERAGDRATAITTYRFVASVGAGTELAPYAAAARAALKRLGAADTLPGPPR